MLRNTKLHDCLQLSFFHPILIQINMMIGQGKKPLV